MELLNSEAAFLTDNANANADAVLKSLGIINRDELEALVALFYAEGEHGPNAKPIVHPNDTIKIIRQFVVDKQHASSAVQSELSKEKRDPQKAKEKEFWSRLANVISERDFRLWTALESSLQKYNKILEDRSNAMEDTIRLQQQVSFRLKS